MPEADLELLIGSARAAGDIALRHWRGDFQTWDKDDGAGPVTEADLEVDAHLRETLLAARPGYGWLSEETEDDADRLGRSRVFVIDPIDGTRSFAAGETTWAHSLAVVEDGVPIAGVIFLPARQKLYAAVPGRATRDGQPIRATARAGLDGAEVLAPRNVLEPGYWAARPPAMARHFRPSLAYRMALVAEGRFDAMMTLRPVWEWDIAAGALIAEAAGAVVSDQRGQPLRFNSPTRKTDGTLAAGAALHGEIHAALRHG